MTLGKRKFSIKSLSSLKRAVGLSTLVRRNIRSFLTSVIGYSDIVSGSTSIPPTDTDWNVMFSGYSFSVSEVRIYVNDFVHCVCHP